MIVASTSPGAVVALLFGGLGLMLYGVRLATAAVQRAAGARLRHTMLGLGARPLLAFGAGLLATAVSQSSGATSAMLVSLVSAGLVPLAGAVGVLLGANVGSTLALGLLALQLTDYVVALAGLGAAAALTGRRLAQPALGDALFGVALVLLGLGALGAASAPVAASPLTAAILTALAGAPLVLALLGALLTVAFASTAAAVAVVLVMAGGGALSTGAALALLLGANVGSVAPALWAAMSGRALAGRRLALLHGGTKLAGALAGLAALPALALTLEALVASPAARVAAAHIGFNLALAAVALPLTRPLARLAERLLPERRIAPPDGPRYLDPAALGSPAIALGLATRETLRMAELVTEMLGLSLQAFTHDDPAVAERLSALDDQVDALEGAIKGYLTRVDELLLSEAQAQHEKALFYITADLEAIGDLIDKQLMRLARRSQRAQLRFSTEEWRDLVQYHREVTTLLEQALASLATQDAGVAETVVRRKKELSSLRRQLHLAHIQRLRGAPERLVSSAIHLDLLTTLGRVLTHTSSIAHAVLGDR